MPEEMMWTGEDAERDRKTRWETKIGYAGPDEILVRGYPLPEITGNLTYAETLFLILKGELPTDNEAKMMDGLLNGLVEHYLITVAAPAARLIAAGNPDDPLAAIAGGVLSMGRVTGSPQRTAEEIVAAVTEMKEKKLSFQQEAKSFVQNYREHKKRIPGIGHPSHKSHGDPRAQKIRKLAKMYGFIGEHTQMLESIRDEYAKIPGKETIPVNIDGMEAAVILDMGFKPIHCGPIAALSFQLGIIGHVIEELENPKLASRMPLFPRGLGAVYAGPAERHLPKEKLKT